jgi:hypothetical protein
VVRDHRHELTIHRPGGIGLQVLVFCGIEFDLQFFSRGRLSLVHHKFILRSEMLARRVTSVAQISSTYPGTGGVATHPELTIAHRRSCDGCSMVHNPDTVDQPYPLANSFIQPEFPVVA